MLFSCNNSSDAITLNEITQPIQEEQNSLYVTNQWELSSPTEENFDEVLLQEAFDQGMSDGSFTQSTLVIRNERIVHEEYRGLSEQEKQTLINANVPDQIYENFDYRDKFSLASSWSVAKSFVSILIGIAIDEGYISSIDELASNYIYEWADDNRSFISIRELLNMRSGLVPICRDYIDPDNRDPVICQSYTGSGGDLLPFADITSICINREIAEIGVIQPWFSENITWEENYFLYINCDTQVLGEILERAIGSDLETYAEMKLFSKIGFYNYWWQDKTNNHTAYCCLDAVPRDFAKFGQLILNYGSWGREQVVSESYIREIRSIYPNYVVNERDATWAYGMQFWTFGFPRTQEDGTEFPTYPIYSAIGYDGQYIIIDFEKNMIVIRNSLYHPYITTGERAVSVEGDLFTEVNFPNTLPNTMGIEIYFDSHEFLYKVHKSIIE